MGRISSPTLGDHSADVTGAVAAAAAAVTDAAALTSSAADEDVTKVHADLVALRAKVNALLASLRSAGLLDS